MMIFSLTPQRTLALLLSLCALSACDDSTDTDTNAGAEAGSEAGVEAGVEAGAEAGAEAGVEAGAEAGVEAGTDTLSIIGAYLDDYNTSHLISETSWDITYEGGAPSVHLIERFDNELGFLIALNDERNEFSPGAYSRFDWTFVGEELWFCQSAFDAESAEVAAEASADATDPSTMGCGGFPWSRLTPTP